MSTINVKFKNVDNDVYDFILEVDDSITVERNYFGLRLDPFQYGNDQDLDTIIYPGSVSFEFSLLPKQINSGIPNPFGDPDPYIGFGTPLINDVDNDYFVLTDAFSFNDTEVTINKNGVEHFTGYIDTKNVGNDYGNRSISLTVLSNFGKLKTLDPHTLDPDDFKSYPYDVAPNNQALFVDLISKLIRVVYPTALDMQLFSNVYAETSYTLLGVPQSVNANHFGGQVERYIGTHSEYTTASDIIKDILSLFGAVGIFKDNIFTAISRFYTIPTNTILSKDNYLKSKGPSLLNTIKFDGLQIFTKSGFTYEYLYGGIERTVNFKSGSGELIIGEIINWSTGSAKILSYSGAGTTGWIKVRLIGECLHLYNNTGFTGATSGSTAQFDGDTYDVENSDLVETISYPEVGGDPPGVDGAAYPLLVRNIWLHIPAFISGLGYETWVTSNRNVFYITGGTKKALWKCISDEIYDLIIQNRKVYSQELPGLNWSFGNSYSFEPNTDKFRVKKFHFDEMNGSTKIELIKG